MLIIRGVNVFPTQIEERVLEQPGLAAHYQLRVTRDGNLDILTVIVECTHESVGDDRDSMKSGLKKQIKAYVGVTAIIELREPGEVPRSEGKAVRVIVERK